MGTLWNSTLNRDPDKALRSDPAKALRRRGRIRPVSAKRAAANRVRSAMADRLWPDRREGTVMCGCGRPDCNRRADDLHETLTRARSGGDITSPDIWIPLARECHDEIQLGPDWAYEAKLLIHSWDAEK